MHAAEGPQRVDRAVSSPLSIISLGDVGGDGGVTDRATRGSGFDGQGGAVADRANLVQRDYEARAAALDAKPHVQAWNNGSRDAVSSVLRSFGTVRSLVVGAYAEASDDLHQLFDCVVESASKQHWRRIGARSAKEARSYFATTLRRAWGCLLYTSPSPRDRSLSRMPSSA